MRSVPLTSGSLQDLASAYAAQDAMIVASHEKAVAERAGRVRAYTSDIRSIVVSYERDKGVSFGRLHKQIKWEDIPHDLQDEIRNAIFASGKQVDFVLEGMYARVAPSKYHPATGDKDSRVSSELKIDPVEVALAAKAVHSLFPQTDLSLIIEAANLNESARIRFEGFLQALS